MLSNSLTKTSSLVIPPNFVIHNNLVILER